MYIFQTRGVRRASLNLERSWRWSGSSVAGILEREEYLGHTINCRSYVPSFKSKNIKGNPPDKWLRFENTHEPLVDRETGDIVQKVRQGKRRPNKMGEQDILSGLVFCKDCGTKHYFCRCGSWNESQFNFTCGRYHKHKGECSPHSIKTKALHQIVLMKIREVSEDVREHRDEFLQRLSERHNASTKKELATKERELERIKKRLSDLDKLFKKAFEESVLENLSQERFHMLTEEYEAGKSGLIERQIMLESDIAKQQEQMIGTERFLKLVDKYTDIQKLTSEIAREFIERIEIHNRSEPFKKKDYTQQIDIYFNFVGKL